MMKSLPIVTAVALMLPIPGMAAAQAPAESAAPSLTFDMARTAMDAAEAEARANDWNVTIAITDAAGVPVYLRRLDGASPRSYEVALRKAATVVATGLATSVYGQRVESGQVEAVDDGVTFAGGVPVVVDGEVVGAIGTSGVAALDDEIISQAGADAIAN
jgi:glc operon protein GlcG